jgi:DMSO reductase family type II enzyme heme b subunit
MPALLTLATALHIVAAAPPPPASPAAAAPPAAAAAAAPPAAAAAASSLSPAGARYLAAEGIDAVAAAAVPAGPDDPAWDKAPATRVVVAAQRTLGLPDRDAQAGLADPAPGAVVVRAVATPTTLAVRVEWSDPTDDRTTDETDRYGDAVALQVPLSFGAGRRLPYIGMGDAGASVLVHMARATPAGPPVTRDIVAAGYGSGTRAPSLRWMQTSLSRQTKTPGWRATFVRPLATAEHALDGGLVPLAFAVWDGARHQRGGHKLLSSWRVLRLPGRAVDAAFLDELAFGYHDGDVGDPARGKGFVDAVCVSCHRIGDKAMAPVDLAPELTHVGVLSTYGYLRDSLLAPSLVLVPDHNRNRHQARGAPALAHGAWANAPLGAFAVVDAAGRAQSTMPAFALPKEQLADVIAYLKTLGTPAPAPSSSPSASPSASPSP